MTASMACTWLISDKKRFLWYLRLCRLRKWCAQRPDADIANKQQTLWRFLATLVAVSLQRYMCQENTILGSLWDSVCTGYSIRARLAAEGLTPLVPSGFFSVILTKQQPLICKID